MAKFDKQDFEKAVKAAAEKLANSVPTYEFTLGGERIPKSPALIKPDEKWIWVEGYKGTTKDMQGHGNYQFEIGKRYDMPTDVEIQDCHAGFHLSLNLKDVFNHYDIGQGNRFFKVRALVREKDYEEYGVKTSHPYYGLMYGDFSVRNKLASQSIEFIRELTLDEIFESVDGASTWSEEYKKMAIDIGVGPVRDLVNTEELVKLGYSEAFATYVVKKNREDIAKVVASQPGLSMDVKALMIMNW